MLRRGKPSHSGTARCCGAHGALQGWQLRELATAVRTAGKLMQGLASELATPSPHTEYLGITYFEVSDADRSSALGLRLNQQNKTKNKNNKTLCEESNGRSFVQSVQHARSAAGISGSQVGRRVGIIYVLLNCSPISSVLCFPFHHNCKDKSPPDLLVA